MKVHVLHTRLIWIAEHFLADAAVDLTQSPAFVAESSVKENTSQQASKSDTLPSTRSASDITQAQRSHHSKSRKRSHSKSASPAPSSSRSADKKRRHGGSARAHRHRTRSRSHSRSRERLVTPPALERDDMPARASSEMVVAVEERRSERNSNGRGRLEDRLGEPRVRDRRSTPDELRGTRREEDAADLHALRRAPPSGSSSGSDREEPPRGSTSYAQHERKHSLPYAVATDDRYAPVALRVNERERYRPLVDPYPRPDRLVREEYSVSGHRSDLQLRRFRLDRP